MIDLNCFRNKLTELLVSAEYENSNPINLFACTVEDINSRKAKAIHMYQNDPIFHARISHLTAYIVQIADECNAKTNPCAC